MPTLFAPTALLPTGWAENVLIEYDKDGWITGVDSFKPALPADSDAEIIRGPLLAGMSNVHSHAFQRAMAGLTERAAGKKDTFWNWRETMYRFLAQVDPDSMAAIAAELYMELLKAGYTTVGEFHYVHHQPDGTPYDRRAEMSDVMVRAALETGIGLVHMPSLYAYGGFGAEPVSDGQKRFLNTVDDLMSIIADMHENYKSAPQISLGMGLHSLRAVSPEMMTAAIADFRRDFPQAPIHMHVAEQMVEVENCVAWSGKRPVEFLLENAPVDERWCLIHCTHMTDAETAALAKTGAVVGLCPTTEANLGDGIFPLRNYIEAGGRFAIGSDSHISVNMIEELRWLEYVQRLVHQERTVVKTAEVASVGGALYDFAVKGGAQALARKTGRIEAGYRADFLVLDSSMPVLQGKLRDHILDAAVFGTNENPVRDVMAGGRWVVRDRQHRRETTITDRYLKAVAGFK